MGSVSLLLTSLVWLTLLSCTLASEDHSTHHHHHHQDHQEDNTLRHDDQHDDQHDDLEEEAEEAVAAAVGQLGARLGSIPHTTWLAGFSSIAVISLVGLLTVGIIPMLRGPHQDSALQLLVSLAVGTLVGDALMHLLPHALQTGHGDTSVIWKGFTASLTIIAFFVMDRVMEGLGHSHSHAVGDHSGSDEENLTVSTRTSRESTPVSKVSLSGSQPGQTFLDYLIVFLVFRLH